MFGLFKKNYQHTATTGKKAFFKKFLIAFLIFLIITAVSFFFFIYLPYLGIKAKATVLVKSGTAVKNSFKNNNIDDVKKNLNKFEKDYSDFETESKKVYWLKIVPFAGSYISDFRNGVEAGDELIKAAQITTDSMVPYADLIGFKKGSSFVEKSADDRIQTAVLTLDKVLVKVDEIALHIDRAAGKISKIDEKRYPEKWGKRNIRDSIKNTKAQFEGVASLFVDAKPLIKKLPDILGTNHEKTYLVLFQNDKELRPTGGFLTAYAIFKIKAGKFKVEKSEDIYHLDLSIARHPKAPPEILTYHKGVSDFYLRDSNLSPDLVKSLSLFDSLYQNSGQKVKYDGIFLVDTHLLVDMLEILGETEASGLRFSSKIDKRCNCPQVVYALLNEIDRPVNYIKDNRKGLLGDLLYAIMQKALGFSPSRYWGRLSQVFFTNLQQKHILLNLNDKELQKAVEAMNFGGRIKDYDGDYLHINDANFAGAKSNLFVTHKIVSDTKIDSDGSVERTVTIEYKNPYPHSDCNLERGGLCLNAELRNWLRIFVPKGSTLISFQGSETKVKTYDDLSKTVFEGFMTVKPLGKSKVIIKYKLPFTVKNINDYKLLIQKQPGTKGHEYEIYINGRLNKKLKLIEDYELKI